MADPAIVPTVFVELVPGVNPHLPSIQVRFAGVDGGWTTVCQMLSKALDAALIQAFNQLAQSAQTPQIMLADHIPDLKH